MGDGEWEGRSECGRGVPEEPPAICRKLIMLK